MFDIKNLLVGALLMLKKFTIFDIKFYADVNDEDYDAGIYFLPLIGLVIGIASYLISLLCFVYNKLFIGLLLVIYYLAITKFTNIKETVKSVEYLYRDKKDINLYIQLLTTGILVTYYTLFSIIPYRVIALLPLAGYCSLIISSNFVKRNKSNTFIIKHCKKTHIAFAFVISFICALFISSKSAIALSATYCICILITCLADMKIKIMPSSVEGMLIEASQIIFLLISYILFL